MTLNNYKENKEPANRRKFIKNSLIGGITFLSLPINLMGLQLSNDPVKYKLNLQSPTRYFDGENCFVHPRAGIIPLAGKGGNPRVVMTMTSQDLSGSDVFKAAYGMQTDDLGKTWTNPMELKALEPRYEIIDGVRRPVAISDFWPAWHKKSKTLLGTGHTVVYTPDWKVSNPRPRDTSYSIYEPDYGWSNWNKLEMPALEKFEDCGAGSVQRYDKSDGTILLPVYYRSPGNGTTSSVTVIRCTFYNKKLQFLEQGNELHIDVPRGYGEPSLTHFKGNYYLTLRNDKQGYVTKGVDGLNFEEPKPWTFDDGEALGNYNTQQHWVTHSDGLFLVYTRRGADNDHVFRHRAPLFMAQVDPNSLSVIRKTEKILVPERGARLGNFGITDISPNETWVTVSEWMQPSGVEKHGSDGSIFIARIHWDQPNKLFEIL
ncbi:exo-alpha-sialidase [Cyclobacterium sp. 1_MG-2023]|uniref:exo-alpha-sialidase n=1 Tax=Cyclobacterium sp. 1_MG-2023 TaxID=3062681 RepID=UPI0026E340B2|nr:exo-alpha-sialidase [Cyclobacterium sp. 1_MG-2023]MDO6438995.1 exo-alpha-sialidase [Cyclobacterium sp. 1_MG-2023]